MRWRRSLGLSVDALLAHKVRTALALASVAAGVAAVVLTSAIGDGAQRGIDRGIDQLGVNLLVVRPAQVKRLAARKELQGTVTTLVMEDRDALAALPLVARAAPGVESPVRVKAGAAATMTRMLGTTSDFPTIRGFTVRSGRFFDDEDEREARRVVVLGARVADALFDENPVARQIRIRRVPFEVIGVLAPKGSLADGDEDNQVLVPISTALRRVLNITWLNAVFVTVRRTDPRSLRDAESAIAALFRERHRAGREGRLDIEIQNAARFFTMQRTTADSLGRLTTGLGAIALLVGGAGIMALMLLSVRERTSEIGLRMAVGAKPRDILVQFLLEATMLSLGGWFAGVALGLTGAALLAASTSWPVAAPVNALLISLAMALTIGLGFGAVPARRAALIPPMRALATA
ncbi:MAG: ABC transporter permease [Gemmatimonadaceae bacterium]